MIQDSLIETIVGRRDEDAPRLIYADWLEEHGCIDQSDFIRVQCRLSELEAAFHEATARPHRLHLARERAQWRRRQDALLQNNPQWYGKLESRGIRSATFRRGFVEIAQFKLDGSTRVRDLLPLVPVLADVTIRSVSSKLAEEAIAELAESRQLTHLRRLCFSQVNLGDESLVPLFTSPRNSQVQALDLSWNLCVSDTSLTDLAASSALPHLESIDLRGTSCSVDGLRILASSDKASTLREVFLNKSPRRDEDLRIRKQLSAFSVRLSFW